MKSESTKENIQKEEDKERYVVKEKFKMLLEKEKEKDGG
jgi:hypothetical protein